MGKRYEQLDSLRGIAALFVVFFHLWLLIPKHLMPENRVLYAILEYSPLRVLIMGYESVIFFFILSGFVLALPYYLGKNAPYGQFMVKRVCRIWIPYAVAISVAILLRAMVAKDAPEGVSSWFTSQWSTPIDTSLIVNHYLLIGHYDQYAFNASIWSLIHEMRVSIVFPLIMLMVMRFGWRWSLAVGVGFALLGGLLHMVFKAEYQAWYKSLPYILTFTVGAVVALKKDELVGWYQALSSVGRWIFGLVAWLVYAYSPLLADLATGGVVGNILKVLSTWGITIAAVMVIVAALGSDVFSRVLHWRPLHFIGVTSYSLYLWHLPLILTIVYLGWDVLGFWGVCAGSLLATLIVSALSYYAVEVPSMKAGQVLAKLTGNRAGLRSR